MAAVAVVGLGNIGTVFAAHLIAGERHHVTACVRRPIENLIVEAPGGRIRVSVACATDAGQAVPVDWVLLATKTQDTAGTAPWLKSLCRPGTRVAVLQNGVDQQERVHPFCGEASVVPTVIYTNSKRLGPGSVRHMRPDFDLAVPDSADARATVELFAGADIRIRTETDFITAAWRKFLINLVANPLTAIAGRGIGVLRQPDMEGLARDLLRESAAIGRAAGADLDPNTADGVLHWLAGFPGDVGTSMLEDRLAGRPLEHDAITGVAVRLGRTYGVPTPINSVLLAILRGLDPYESPISSTSK